MPIPPTMTLLPIENVFFYAPAQTAATRGDFRTLKVEHDRTEHLTTVRELFRTVRKKFNLCNRQICLLYKKLLLVGSRSSWIPASSTTLKWQLFLVELFRTFGEVREQFEFEFW